MSGYNEMLQKYRDIDEDEIMSGLTKDELARLENEIDREILERPPEKSGDSESYTTASSSSDEADCDDFSEICRNTIEEDIKKDIVDTVQSQTNKASSLLKSKPDAFTRGKLDKTQLKPVQKSLLRQKSKEKSTFKLPQLKKTTPRNDRRMSGDDVNNTLKNELVQAVKKREGKRRTKRVNSSGVSRRPSYVSSKTRRNSKITRYRDGNERQVDAAVVNRNFMTDELMNLRPKLRKINVKEPTLVLPDELHGVSFDRITAGARRKLEDEDGEIEDIEHEQATSEDGDASRNSAFGYDADADVTPSDDSYLPGEDDCQPCRRKAMSESSEAPSEGIATMASTASNSAESCDMFAAELSINPTSVEEMLERIRDDDPTLVEVNLNNIHDVPIERFEELAVAMEDNTHVTSLSLANTGLTDRAAKALAVMLKKNQTLKKLNVESNFITGEGGRRLISALRKNNCLVELSLNNQRHIFGAKAEQDMSKMLKENTSLLKLGYQFANPGLRMATSNILTKNMDLVRRKRVAEEKKRQAGQHKRPQLRRQPSSEWYRKERLEKFKKLQEHSKMLGLDPSKRIGENDVERVLQNMSKDEVTLLERWFTSKLLGMVDKPPTSSQQEEATTSVNANQGKDSKNRSDDTKSERTNPSKNLLNLPSRTKRSKSPVIANRGDLLDSIRKSSPNVLRKDCNSTEQQGPRGHSVPGERSCDAIKTTIKTATPQETASPNIAISHPAIETELIPAKLHGTNFDKIERGCSDDGPRLDMSHTLPADETVAMAMAISPSPEVREWKEGEEYDSDEYEVVEVEVTDSEEELGNTTVAESSRPKLRTDEKCCSIQVEDNNRRFNHVPDRLASQKYTTSSGTNSRSGAISPTVSHGLSLDTRRQRTGLSDSDCSNPPSPLSPRFTSTSPLLQGKPRIAGDFSSVEARYDAASPQSHKISSIHPTAASASRQTTKRSPVNEDIKPEALSTINSFFNFK